MNVSMVSLSFSSLVLFLAAFISGINGQECDADGVTLTPFDALGPFYVANSPVRELLAPREQVMDPADVLHVEGEVVGNDCVPLANAIVEAWYAGDEVNGVFYSDTNFRGQLVTDECGSFRFRQTFPALYPQRPIPHIHYRISSADGTLVLVTQLYFEGFIPGWFDPDDSQIAAVVDEEDGSRSVMFRIYVRVPGTADAAACAAGANETLRPTESLSTSASTTTIAPSSDSYKSSMTINVVTLLAVSALLLIPLPF